MGKVNSYNRNSIITGVLGNLAVSVLFVVFIILGYRSTTENAAIQDDTFRTHFQSRLILKSINGLNYTRANLLMRIKNKNVDDIIEAEDHFLGAQSNYLRLVSEQELNKGRLSLQFKEHFEEIKLMFNSVLEDEKNFLQHIDVIDKIISHSKKLIEGMHDEESTLWVDESIKLHAFSKVKERNLYIFYGLTFSFVTIELMFIYFTMLRYRLNKKLNLESFNFFLFQFLINVLNIIKFYLF